MNGGDWQAHDSSAEIRLPAVLLSRLMPDIDDLAELKLTVFFLAAIHQKEGKYRYLRWEELLGDGNLLRGLAACDRRTDPEGSLREALRKAIGRGTLLRAELGIEGVRRQFYFLNDQAGRELQAQLQAGRWRPAYADEIEILPARPTLFSLYEENIGILTPMIAEALRAAQSEYPPDWIEEAMRYAVERGARNWRYVQRVLEGWQQEGRSHEKTGRHLERRKQYAAGEWKDYIKS